MMGTRDTAIPVGSLTSISSPSPSSSGKLMTGSWLNLAGESDLEELGSTIEG